MKKNIGKNTSKNLSNIYSWKFLDHSKQSGADSLNATSKKVIQKTVKATDDLIGNEIFDKITKV